MVGSPVEEMVAELAKVMVVGIRKEEEEEKGEKEEEEEGLGRKNGWMGVEVGVVSSWSECW
jgi:hypothetical protein